MPCAAAACPKSLTSVALGLLETRIVRGAFWLNPCLPHDPDGFAVDPETGLRPDEEPGFADEDEVARMLLDDIDPR